MIDVVSLTKKIIRCPSVTPNDAGAQSVLIEPLKEMGFKIFDLPFEGNGSYPVKNFFARLGTGSPHICYAGHKDVVPAGDEASWTHPPFDAVIENGVMYGRGTSDMKGGNTAFIAAISQFLEQHKDFQGSISLLITGDEEADAVNGTVRVLEWMHENGHVPDVCLVGESSNIKELGEEIKIGRRGSISGDVTITGTQGHVAYPDLAENPLPELAHIAVALSQYEFDQGTENFPPTNLEITSIDVGNSTRNIIPKQGTLKFNVRFNTEWTAKSIEDKLHDIINNISTRNTFTTRCSAHPFLTDPGEWTDIVSQAVKKHTNRTPALTTGGGTSDARFIANYCPVVEFGLTNETIHQVDENLKVENLIKLVDIYQDILTLYLS